MSKTHRKGKPGVTDGDRITIGLVIGAMLGVAMCLPIGAAIGDAGLGLIAGTTIGPAIGLMFALVLYRDLDPTRCSRCHYSLRGLKSARCPECGHHNDEGAG